MLTSDLSLPGPESSLMLRFAAEKSLGDSGEAVKEAPARGPVPDAANPGPAGENGRSFHSSSSCIRCKRKEMDPAGPGWPSSGPVDADVRD